MLVSRSGRLISGNSSNTLKLWSTVAVGESRFATASKSAHLPGLTLDDEMTLDGMMVSAAFDDTLDMVGTCCVMYWYQRCNVMLFRPSPLSSLYCTFTFRCICLCEHVQVHYSLKTRLVLTYMRSLAISTLNALMQDTMRCI